MGTLGAYSGLFFSALVAATLLPLQSEAVLLALLASAQYSAVGLVVVASVGNVLGSLINWWLGRHLIRYQERRWFPVSPQALSRAQQHYARYGRWSLLLSWLPVVGDPLTLVAGLMREPLWRFLLLTTLAKTGRYTVLAAATLAWL